MFKLVFTLFITWVLFSASDAAACKPCMHDRMSLDETIAASELIIIGERLTPSEPNEGEHKLAPQSIEILVHETLKGSAPEKIHAVAWVGSCEYGMIAPAGEKLVMFLKQGQVMYKPVDAVCSQKTLKLIEDNIALPDGTIVDKKTFLQRLK